MARFANCPTHPDGSPPPGLTRVVLGGRLGRRFGRNWFLDANSPAEAIRGILASRPDFEPFVREAMASYRFAVRVGRQLLNARTLRTETGARTIYVYPVLEGAGSSKGIIGTIAGVVLVAAGVVLAFVPGFQAISPYVIGLGISLTFSGIAALLTPAPKAGGSSNRQKASAQFSGPENVTAQGAARPIAYGRLIMGSVVVSSSIESGDLPIESVPADYNPPQATVVYDSNTPAGWSARGVGGTGGGGKSSSGGAKEDKDTLRSTQYGKLIDFLSEGPIVGVVGADGTTARPAQGIYYNETRLENPDGTSNFKSWTVTTVNGEQQQSPIIGFDAEVQTESVSVELTQINPFVRTIEDTTVDSVRVDFRLDSLTKTDKKSGDVHGNNVNLAIDVSQDGGRSWVQVKYVEITGKNTGGYTKTVEVKLPKPGVATIRVRRASDDLHTIYESNRSFIDALSYVWYRQLTHPNSALVASSFDAQQFSSFPQRAFDVKGRIVNVPANYDPIARTYAGAWDGTFKLAWTDNPAWVWHDLVVNKRYGLGDIIRKAQVDKFGLYQAGAYADQMVPDGFGGMEPRFTFNGVINSRTEAAKVLQDIASNFRGTFFYRAGNLMINQDRQAPYVREVFGPSNVIDGLFTYQSTARTAQKNVCTVKWNDPANLCKWETEAYSDDLDILVRGKIETEVVAIGCTSRGQAQRLAKYTVITNRTETETCTWKTGLMGGHLVPGDVVDVSNPWRAGADRTGIVVTADGGTVTLDRPIDLSRAPNPKIGLLYFDEDQNGNTTTRVQQWAISDNGTSVKVVHVTDPNFAPPIPNSQWVVSDDTLKPEKWRIISLAVDDVGIFTITGTTYNGSKYAAVDANADFFVPPTSILPNEGTCLPPGTVTVTEIVPQYASVTPYHKLQVGWQPSPDPFIRGYHVEYRLENGNYQVAVDETSATDYDLTIQAPGQYDFQVFAVNLLGVKSAPSTASYQVSDVSQTAPFSITGLELVDLDGSGEGNNHFWRGPNIRIRWRLNDNTTTSADAVSLPGHLPLTVPGSGGLVPRTSGLTQLAATPMASPVASGAPSSLFQDYLIDVIDPATDATIYSTSGGVAAFTLDYAHNADLKKASGGAGAYNHLVLQVRARDRLQRVSEPARIDVSNPPPDPATSLTAASSFKNVFLSWVNPADNDLVGTQVLGSQVDDVSTAAVLGTVPWPGDTFVHSGISANQTWFYWVVETDSFNQTSQVFPAGPGVAANPGTVDATDITSFAPQVTALFGNTIVLRGDQFQSNTGGDGIQDDLPGNIYWNAHSLFYRGNEFRIVSGSTNQKYVYIILPNGGVPAAGQSYSYQVSATNPADTVPGWNNLYCFQIAVNVGGFPDPAWHGFANAVIGSAYIKDAAILNAKIADLAVDSAKIADAAIVTAKIGNAAITAAKIASLQIGVNVLPDGTVNPLTVAPGGIVAGNIGTAAVDTGQIAYQAVTIPAAASARGGTFAANWITMATIVCPGDGLPVSLVFSVSGFCFTVSGGAQPKATPALTTGLNVVEAQVICRNTGAQLGYAVFDTPASITRLTLGGMAFSAANPAGGVVYYDLQTQVTGSDRFTLNEAFLLGIETKR